MFPLFPPADTPRHRLQRVLVFYALLLASACVYAGIWNLLGFGIPCLFHSVTGYLCPGCGGSRMFASLLRGDIATAWKSHAALLCLLPLGLAAAGDITMRYVRHGIKHPHKWANALLWFMIAVLLAFCLWRNLRGFS